MNNTAHCFLSYADPDLLLGNFIGDFVKGKTWQKYPAGVQQGVLLHRAIDSFTDNHPATRQSVVRLRPVAGRFAPPLVDILYDHLLCCYWDRFAGVDFDVFAAWTYRVLDARLAEMPEKLQKRWPLMREGRFLHGYQTREGLAWVLEQFSRRLPGDLRVEAVAGCFFDDIEAFSADFEVFFPDLQEHVQQFRAGL